MTSSLDKLIETALDMSKFGRVIDYVNFASSFLSYIDKEKQAEIVSENEKIYRFFQFPAEADYRVTRPFNSEILLREREFSLATRDFEKFIRNIHSARSATTRDMREALNRSIYSIQQCIGFVLDAAPSGKQNHARKINGTLFERLILLLLKEAKIQAKAGLVSVPVVVDGKTEFSMSYQHDFIVTTDSSSEDPIVIGSVKTTSKDRIDKIFMDKFLYSKLTETEVPHVAIFLHDVQRKQTSSPNKYGVNSTFLSNHFKGFTVKLNPLDGVYYFDLRPNMISDPLLAKQIFPFDKFICEDIWSFISKHIE